MRILPDDVIALVPRGRAHAECALVHVLGVSLTVQERVDGAPAHGCGLETSRQKTAISGRNMDGVPDPVMASVEREGCCRPCTAVELMIGGLSVPADEKTALWLLAWSRQPYHLQRQMALETLEYLRRPSP